MGLPSECTGDQEETLEHCFRTCKEVKKAWEFFRYLRRKANLSQEPENWEEMLMGKALTTTRQIHKEEIQWGATKAYTITSNTPWDMLRTNLLWNIWTQKCKHNFMEGNFNLASAMHNAWQTTIQIGMAAWYEIRKFRDKRKQQRQAQLEETFINIWTEGEIFSSKHDGSIHWKFTLDASFLTKELAEEVTTTRDQRRRRRTSPSSPRSPAGQRGTTSINTQGRNTHADTPHSDQADEAAAVETRSETESANETNEREEEDHLADIRALLALKDPW